MARASLVHHDRTCLKKELQQAEDEWKLLNRNVNSLKQVIYMSYYVYMNSVLKLFF